MSSREIAKLTGKRHDHVMRDIRTMLASLQINGPNFGGVYIDTKGETRSCFNLPKRETLILVSGYSVELRARIIDRWMEMEEGQAKAQAAPITVTSKKSQPVFRGQSTPWLKRIYIGISY